MVVQEVRYLKDIGGEEKQGHSRHHDRFFYSMEDTLKMLCFMLIRSVSGKGGVKKGDTRRMLMVPDRRLGERCHL